MKKISNIYSTNPILFRDIDSLLKSENFPCLFAINSFHKDQMYIYDARDIHHELALNIYNKLTSFAEHIKKEEGKNFYTLIVVIKEPENISPIFLEEFIFSILIKLKEQDSTIDTISKSDILMNDFKFSLDQNIWFPVFLCPKHISTVRQSNIAIIAFQPNQTFDLLKSHPNNFYEKTRKATHKRIDKIYQNKKPFFLSEKSSGINAIQYLGFDPIHPNEK